MVETRSTEAPLVSVLIVAFQAGKYLGRCLEALEKQTFDRFEVILFDNASTDRAVEQLGETSLDLKVISSPSNVGFACANNRAADAAEADYIVTLNPDAFPEPQWLESLVAAADRHPKAAAVGSIQLLDSDPEVLDGIGDPYHLFSAAWRGGKDSARRPIAESEVFGVCAAAALYRKEAFQSVGGFAESFFCYYEDVDLGFRLRLAGWTAIMTPNAVVRHVGSGTTTSKFVQRYATRNRILTYFRCMPIPLLLLGFPGAFGVWMFSVFAGLIKGGFITKISAVFEAFSMIPSVAAERARINETKRASMLDIARALTWSPLTYMQRRIDLRPLGNLPDYLGPANEVGTKVVAVIVSYNPDEDFDKVLVAALEQCHRVVLIDNASEPDTQKRLAARNALEERLVFIQNDENVGLAHAQNQGIDEAKKIGCDWVLLLDDDSIAAPDMVEQMLVAYKGLENRERVGILAPRLTDEHGTLLPIIRTSSGRFHFETVGLGKGDIVRDVAFAIASGSLIRSDALDIVGNMIGDFFIDYVDIEFCLRMRGAGFETVAIGNAELKHRLGEHFETTAMGKPVSLNTHSARRRYFIHRNRVNVWRDYGWDAFGWLVFDIIAAFYDIYKAGFLEDNRLSKVRAIFKGHIDGWSRSIKPFRESRKYVP